MLKVSEILVDLFSLVPIIGCGVRFRILLHLDQNLNQILNLPRQLFKRFSERFQVRRDFDDDYINLIVVLFSLAATAEEFLEKPDFFDDFQINTLELLVVDI